MSPPTNNQGPSRGQRLARKGAYLLFISFAAGPMLFLLYIVSRMFSVDVMILNGVVLYGLGGAFVVGLILYLLGGGDTGGDL